MFATLILDTALGPGDSIAATELQAQSKITDPFFGSVNYELAAPAWDITARGVVVGATGFPGSVPSAATYTDPGFDDTVWPLVDEPVFTDDYLSFGSGFGTSHVSGTMVSPSDHQHAIIRKTLYFPPKSALRLTAAGTGWGGTWVANGGERLYLMQISIDDVAGDLYMADRAGTVQHLLNWSGPNPGANRKTYILSQAPGNRLWILDRTDSDLNLSLLSVKFWAITGSDIPPLRQYPRDDYLGGSPRQDGSSTSVQTSPRQGWTNTYR